MARIEDQPRPKHRIAIFFIAPERKHNRNHCSNYLGSTRLFRIAISIPLKHNKISYFLKIYRKTRTLLNAIFNLAGQSCGN
ncbi:hypothetical protein JQK15_09865 [Sphingobium sp. BHU LFT2]|uniref:hypothetical protein n=1 Tax=Sphingobium sp. BHU LFT2 TaxID=2807634 RepID=UPI001BE81E8D|nr:hypothetical protein [Sphingobium sp. BHU LFT2]MBT2243842.1 hypothetical protein [Sphingobium sp. BHU LFT2]